MKVEITGIHFDVSERLKNYIEKKITGLDKYVARRGRESARAEVKLKESKSKDKKEYTCEVILFLPGENIEAKDSTVNMFAAVDIVEAKLRTQLKKYKDLHGNPKLHRRLINRFRSDLE